MIGEMLLLLPFQMSTVVSVSRALRMRIESQHPVLFACQRTNRGLSHLRTIECSRFQTGTDIRHSRTIKRIQN